MANYAGGGGGRARPPKPHRRVRVKVVRTRKGADASVRPEPRHQEYTPVVHRGRSAGPHGVPHGFSADQNAADMRRERAREAYLQREFRLQKIAQRISVEKNLSPDFVHHLQRMQAQDPFFQDDLNEKINQLAQIHEAKVNSSPLGIFGNTVEQMANPVEWGAAGVRGVGEFAHGHLGSGLLDTAGILPISRGPRAVIEGLRAAHGAEEGLRAAEAADAAARSYRSGRGLLGGGFGLGRKGAKKVGQRVFKVGDLEATQAGADSRIGRSVEAALDRHRGVLSKLGLMNTLEEKAGRRSAAHIQARAHVGTSPGDALLTIVRRPKWTRAKDYALRILAEHSLPGTPLSVADRRAFHLGRAEEAKAAGDNLSATYHRIHARLIKRAAKYLHEDTETGAITIAKSAPNDVKEAWRLLQKTAQGREDVYRDIGRLSDLQIGRRIQAPGRVFQGARWMPDEQVIQHVLNENQRRAELFDLIDRSVEDPRVAQSAKEMIDASARHAAELAAAEGHDPVTGVDELFNELAGVSHGLPEGPALEQIDPFHGFPEEKTNRNLRAKLNPRTAKSGLPLNRARASKEGIHFAGRITPEKWVQRVLHVMESPEAIDHASRWYEHFEPLFRKEFPPEIADKIIRAFSVSQANASPSSGLASALAGLERLDRGEESVGSIGSVVADNIERALKGEKIDSKVAAKLSDFIDALRGSDTRTWMGHAPEGGAPAPIDIWGLRDLGYIDKKIASKGRDKRLLKLHGVDINKLKIDNPGSASGARYERAAEKYHEITDYLNEHNFNGRNDWTPAQTQALGWAAIQKFYAQEPEDLVTAITKGRVRAKGILKRADLQKIVEETKQSDGGFTLHGDLTPDHGKDGVVAAYAHFEKRIPASEFSVSDLTAYAREHKDLLRNPDLRVGGWHNPADGLVYLDVSRVFPTREEALAFAHEHGQVSVFDRAAADRGDIENAFPRTKLSVQEADDIKAAARAKAAAPKRYRAILDRYAQERWGLKRVTARDRAYAEEAMHEAIKSNPDHPLARQFTQLYRDAHEMQQMSVPEPEVLFQKGRIQEAVDSSAGTDLEGLPHKVKVNGEPVEWHSYGPAQDIADSYMQKTGMPYHPPRTYVKVDPERARRIAEWYDQAIHSPTDPEVASAYAAMAKETLDQYHEIVSHGYTFEFYPEGHDPYPGGPREAILDLINNKHMYVFPTETGFGTEAVTLDHPLLADSGELWGGKPVTHNDIFRAVHDFFGHAKEGVGFRADGEENAWRSHSAMYSPEARKAMTAETRGQNSWVNFGPHGEANRTANQMETVYADQKAVVAPDWVVHDGAGDMLAQRSYTGPFGDENRGPLKGAFTEPPKSAGEVAIRAAQKRGVVIKGAHEPTSAGAIIHLVQDHADVSTVIHEWGHFLRANVLDGHAEDVAARWSGATYDKAADKWVWNTDAEEKFARGLEQWAREGRGPSPLQAAFKSAGKALREIYDHTDLPDVSPDMRQVFERLFSFDKQKGGRLLGAEDFHFGVNYVPYTRGAPVALGREAQVFGSYIRHRLQLFNPSKASAIGRGPADVTLKKSFTGALIRTGNFKADVGRASVRSLHTAWRLQSAKMARDVFLKAAEDLPKDATWIAIKVDPEKNLGEDVKRYWDRIHSVGTEKMSAHDLGELEHADANSVDEFIRDLFPGEIEGQRTEEIAQQLSERAGEEMAALKEPIDNIKWIPKELLEATGLTEIPAASNLALRGRVKQQRIAAKAAGFAFDAFNDIQRAGLLILSPSYIPVNLLGNVAMNVLHQGPLAFPNLVRSVLLHRELALEDRVAVDKLMGHGIMESILTLKTGPGELLNHTIGHWSGVVVDLAPRRAAFLYEARQAGYHTPDELRALLHNEANTQDLVRVRDKATEAIVDYERMSPFERNVVSRAIFVYPWIKGATHYSIRFAANHPIETMALALMADNAVDNANSELGPRPFYAQLEIPVSTKSLGLKIPGTDIGGDLSQAVGAREIRGKNGLPYTINPRQLVTQTTPYELAAAIAGTAGAPGLESLAGNFNPGLTTLATFITGHDPNTHQDVPQTLGGMFGALKENFAAVNKIRAVNEADPENRRKLFPRSRNEAIEALFLSGLAPKPFNTAKAAALSDTGSHTLSHEEQAQQWVQQTEKTLGVKLPHEVIVARNSKAAYENLEDEYAKRQPSGKLSPNQHAMVMLHVLVQTHPIYEQYQQDLYNAISEDPAAAQRWIEDKLGWSYLERLDEAVNKEQKAKKLEHSHG